jgi:4-hydroxy-2-oxoheptanedioate aldolase
MKPLSSLFGSTRTVLGTWSQLACAEVVDIIGASGFDFTIVDTEHGFFGLETAENLIRACDAAGLVPLARVPTNEPHLITKALDAGTAAVVVPRVSSADDAEAAVAAARYGPHGTRGACPCVRSGRHYVRDWRAYARAADREAGVIALVETPEGVAAIDRIAGVRGLRAILAGPFDLSVAMGHEGEVTHPDVEAALDRVVEAAAAEDVPLIVPLFAPAMEDCRRQLDRWRRRGVGAFTIGTDKLLLADHCARYVAGLRESGGGA